MRDLASLRGRRVGTLANSLAWDLLRGARAPTSCRYEGVEEPFIDLEHGRTDAVLLDDIIVDRYGARHAGAARRGRRRRGALRDRACAPATPTLRAALDEALGAMIARGELRDDPRALAAWTARARRALAREAAAAAGRPRSRPARGSTRTSSCSSSRARW